MKTKTIACNISWVDYAQYTAMVAMVMAMPVSMNIGVWASCLLALTSVLKMIVDRHVGNRSLTVPQRLALLSAIAYWLIHIASIVMGGDMSEALNVVKKKSVLLIFSLSFLLTNTAYLSKKMRKTLFYALCLSLIMVFVYFTGRAIGRIAHGESLSTVINNQFDTRHHAYVSLYLVTSIAFLFFEVTERWHEWKSCQKWGVSITIAVMVLYLVIINSRAGILALWAVIALTMANTIRLQKWWLMVALLVVASYMIIVGAVLPGHKDRIVETIEHIANGKGDARLDINKSSLRLAGEQSLIGHGIGNYQDNIVEQYKVDEYEPGVARQYNAHNQYLETIISTGIIGLILLLVYLLSLVCLSLWQNREMLFPTVLATVIVCWNLLVESMLERQMGLLFIGYFYAVMVLMIPPKIDTKRVN